MNPSRDYNQELFDRTFFDSLGSLQLPRGPSPTRVRQGGRLGRRFGESLEFADLRPYQAGDDLRTVDWNAYRRFRRLLVRQYQAELSEDIYVLLDRSTSMGVDGSVFASAARIAGALAILASWEYKRCVLLPFSDRLLDQLAQARRGVLPFEALSFLSGLHPEGGTNVPAALEAAAHTVHRGSTLFLISDFFDRSDPEEIQAAGARLKSRRVELYAVHVFALPRIDETAVAELKDSETGDSVQVPVSRRTERDYEIQLRQFQEDLRRRMGAAGAHYLPAPADWSVARVIESLPQGVPA